MISKVAIFQKFFILVFYYILTVNLLQSFIMDNIISCSIDFTILQFVCDACQERIPDIFRSLGSIMCISPIPTAFTLYFGQWSMGLYVYKHVKLYTDNSTGYVGPY